MHLAPMCVEDTDDWPKPIRMSNIQLRRNENFRGDWKEGMSDVHADISSRATTLSGPTSWWWGGALMLTRRKINTEKADCLLMTNGSRSSRKTVSG